MKLLFLFLPLMPPAWTAVPEPDCLVEFTALAAGDGNSVEASTATYDRLLDKLGGTLTPPTLKKLLESADPFQVPEQPGTNLDSLRKHLTDWKGLLEKRGWNTLEVRQALLRRVTARTGAVEEQVTITEQRLSEGWSDFEMKINDFANPAHVMSRDGRYVAIFNIPEDFFVKPGGIEMMLTDRVTGKTLPYPVPEFTDLHGRFTFDPSGSHLYFFSEKQIITAVPMKNGVPQWDQRESFDKGVLGGPLKMPLPGENPRYVFSENKTALQRVDLITKEVTKVDLTAQMGLGQLVVKQVGSVGNTDSLYALAMNDNGWGGKIIAVDFDPSGKPLPSRVVAQWNKLENFKGLSWSSANKPITYQGNSFREWSTPDNSRSIGFAAFGERIPKIQGETPPQEIAVAIHPKGAAVLYGYGRSSWVEYADFGKFDDPKLFRINDGAQTIHFSPDGEVLITKNGSKAHFINHKRRLSEP